MLTRKQYVHAVCGNQKGALRKELVFSIVLVLGIVLLTTVLLYSKRTGLHPLKEGDQAHAFTLQSIDNKQVSLAEFRNKVVLVHFWATWCPPCIEEMPKLEQLYQAFKGKDFEIVAVSVDESGAESVVPFVRKNNITFPVLLDRGGPVGKQYGTTKYPETYVLDRQGKVRYKVIGGIDWTSPDTLTALQRLVAEQ